MNTKIYHKAKVTLDQIHCLLTLNMVKTGKVMKSMPALRDCIAHSKKDISYVK